MRFSIFIHKRVQYHAYKIFQIMETKRQNTLIEQSHHQGFGKTSKQITCETIVSINDSITRTLEFTSQQVGYGAMYHSCIDP